MEKKSIAVLGLGIFGTTVTHELSRFNVDIIAIDKNPEHVQEVADQVSFAVIGDITDFDNLYNVGIQDCDIVIIGTGDNLESSVLAVMHCKKLKVPKIIAKAKNSIFEEVLYEIGVDSVISPERDSGKQLASKVLRNKITEVLRLDSDASFIEFEAPEYWIGKKLRELDLRNEFHINLVGIRQVKNGKLNTLLSPDTIIEANTFISAIASDATLEKFDYLGFLK